jgi:hypothetical protein
MTFAEGFGVSDSRDEPDDFDEDDLEEEDPRDGERVYEACFDVLDGIGSGSNEVYLHRGKFYYVTEGYFSEPLDTLEDAIADGAGELTDCCTWIDCPSIPAQRLVGLLEVHGDSLRLEINVQPWAYDAKTGWRGPERPRKKRGS